MPLQWFYYLHAIVCFLIGVTALYWGVTGKDISPLGAFVPRAGRTPLPKPLGRVVSFIVAGGAFYLLVSGLR